MLTTISFDLKIGNTTNFYEFEMNVNKLNILTGMNNSGKSLIMKIAWYSAFVLQHLYIFLTTHSMEKAKELLKKQAQFYFPLTFTQPEDFNGFFEIKAEGDYAFRMQFERGELIWLEIDVLRPGAFSMNEIQSIQFASKNSRSFISYKQYLKLSKTFNFALPAIKTESATDLEPIKQLADFFPLYDIVWFENVKKILKTYSEDFSQINPLILERYTEDLFTENGEIVSLYLDEEGNPGFEFATGEYRLLESLGSGTQSMLMMTLFLGI